EVTGEDGMADVHLSAQTFPDENIRLTTHAHLPSGARVVYTDTMIITINGKPGSGKSSVAQLLAERLHLEYIDIGEIRRRAAKEKGMTLEEYNKWGETTTESDKPVDDLLVQTGKEKDAMVISGRTAFHFIPHSIKILLDVDMHIAAQRIFNDKKINERNETHDVASVASIEQSLHERMRSDMTRYKKYYSLNVYDKIHYDLVIDTSNISIEQTYEKITTYLSKQKFIS
ncbi:MAG: cytidylate kinase family protein, partial [Patescibacteria group bacterium]